MAEEMKMQRDEWSLMAQHHGTGTPLTQSVRYMGTDPPFLYQMNIIGDLVTLTEIANHPSGGEGIMGMVEAAEKTIWKGRQL